MEFQALRLTQLLAQQSFTLVHSSPAPVWDYRWAAHSPDTRLSLLLVVKGGGEHGEALHASAGVCVGSGWIYFKGLADTELVGGLPYGVPDRAYSLVETDTHAREWEKQLSDLGPRAAARLFGERADVLLAQTGEAIASVDRYLSEAGGNVPLGELASSLRGQAGAAAARRALALAEAPGVLQQAGAEELYEVGALLLVCFGDTVDPGLDLSLSGPIPMPMAPTMWRLQLLADRLRRLRKPGVA